MTIWTGYKPVPVASAKTADELLDDILDLLAVIHFKFDQLPTATVRNQSACLRKWERIGKAVKALGPRGPKATS